MLKKASAVERYKAAGSRGERHVLAAFGGSARVKAFSPGIHHSPRKARAMMDIPGINPQR
ncbi:MAG: hypothetical protein QM681_02030 [Novosphingobium sp.]